MSVNKNKRIILKSNLKTGKKYVGRGDQTEENVISEYFNNAIENQNGKANVIEQKNINEMNNELNSLKTKYKFEKIETAEKLNIINNELSEKNKLLKIIANDNYKLISHLKDIGKNLKGNFLKTYNEILKKRMISIKNEQTLKKDIIVKEEEIKNAKKFAYGEKREKQRYENLLTEVNNGMEENINIELKELNDNIKQLNQEIIELSSFKSIHKYCKKNIQNLQNKLNLYKTEWEFESKKSDMLKNKSYQSPNKVNMSYTESNKNFFFEQNNESLAKKVNYSQIIRNTIMPKSNIKSEKLNISTYRYISDNIKLINKTPSKKLISNEASNISLNLFTVGEYDFLQEIIPSKYMNKYLEEFESKKKQKEEIKNKFEEHNNIKGQKEQIQIKIDYIEIKLKEEEKKHIKLLLKFRNNNKLLKELKTEIKKYEENIKKCNKKIEVKEKVKKLYFGKKNKEKIFF